MSRPVLVALVAALAGMALGLGLQKRLSAVVFRRVFFAGLVALGAAILWRTLG